MTLSQLITAVSALRTETVFPTEEHRIQQTFHFISETVTISPTLWLLNRYMCVTLFEEWENGLPLSLPQHKSIYCLQAWG